MKNKSIILITIFFIIFSNYSFAHDSFEKWLNEFKTVGELITKTLKGLSENPNDNSKVENEVKNEVISLTSSFPIYKNL